MEREGLMGTAKGTLIMDGVFYGEPNMCVLR
jgi:hypothetical protein